SSLSSFAWSTTTNNKGLYLSIVLIEPPAAAVGAAAMRDQDHKNACVEKIKASRVKLTGELEAMGFRIWPSQSNFLLIRPPEGDAARLYEALRKNGILVRYFNQPGLRDKLRVTIGTDRQNAALIDAARGLVGA
ncbi:MAG: aminotransferase class I/II-fold pyridoxal phosphate-dependent enzyme, partial [Planctomycetota bacterium]|nr:aminotransferase class I/II-fold pyridoxal phosphate-dependent enzyme [Planctomycetota bacterium]